MSLISYIIWRMELDFVQTITAEFINSRNTIS